MISITKIKEFAIANGFSSVMNNTKWEELVMALSCYQNFDPLVRIKNLGETPTGFANVNWDEVEQYGFKQIEWIEINPIKEDYIGQLVTSKKEDFSNFIKTGLEKYHIPYQFINGIYKINGYIKI